MTCLQPAFDSIYTTSTCPGNVCQNMALNGTQTINFFGTNPSAQAFYGLTLRRYENGTLIDPTFSVRDSLPKYITFIDHGQTTNTMIITHCNIQFTFFAGVVTVTDGITTMKTRNGAFPSNTNPFAWSIIIASHPSTPPFMEIWYNDIIIASWPEFRINLTDVLAVYDINYYYKTTVFLDRLPETFIRNAIYVFNGGVCSLTVAYCRDLPYDDSHLVASTQEIIRRMEVAEMNLTRILSSTGIAIGDTNGNVSGVGWLVGVNIILTAWVFLMLAALAMSLVYYVMAKRY